jgi:Protein of unknown function (DUF2974)
MNRDLFLAILSMDSYNRGYGFGTKDLSNAVGTRIGTAQISADSVQKLGAPAQAAGFYALAYTVSGVSGMADGTTVIAFRGTDGFSGSVANGGSDAWNGFGVAFGFATGLQAELAVRFYQSVAKNDYNPSTRSSNIAVTGHSLGGGLAGLVAANDNAACERLTLQRPSLQRIAA